MTFRSCRKAREGSAGDRHGAGSGVVLLRRYEEYCRREGGLTYTYLYGRVYRNNMPVERTYDHLFAVRLVRVIIDFDRSHQSQRKVCVGVLNASPRRGTQKEQSQRGKGLLLSQLHN